MRNVRCSITCGNPNYPEHTVRDGVTPDLQNATPKLRQRVILPI
jgi:hypothetical protein